VTGAAIADRGKFPAPPDAGRVEGLRLRRVDCGERRPPCNDKSGRRAARNERSQNGPDYSRPRHPSQRLF